MKKTLLYLSVFAASLFGFTAAAQTTIPVYDNAVFYGMYEGTVSQPLPAGAQRNSNSSYGVKLTDEQLASFGSTLTLNVRAASLCDNYDRIGNVNLAFVPKGATSYVYNQVQRMELGRFITPFMLPDGDLEVPYTYDLSHLVGIFKSPEFTTNFDFWVELEIYGYQGGVGQGGAAAEYPEICSGRNDVYRGSLDFVTSGTYSPAEFYFDNLSFKYELKNYTLDGTDEIGETVRSIAFAPDRALSSANYYIITSNHGSGTNGEEYVRRWHYIYLDDVQKTRYMPGGVSCVPYRQYNTQANCIYWLCDGTSNTRPNTNSAWSWNNWCPGNKVPTRVINLGAVAAGEHTFKINVPDAEFYGGQGYFPMSVYVMGTYATADTDTFVKANVTVTPNPVASVATINTNGEEVSSFTVVNTLGQQVAAGKGNSIDMTQLQSGIYVVKASLANGQSTSAKVVKK